MFEELLKRTMGLDAAAIGPSAIEHAVRERMTTCKISDVCVYEEHVLSSENELQHLVECAVVPETWFFRDADAFGEMARTLAAQALGSAPRRAIRLLSLPCSSGEEPYSMAMALLDAGLPPGCFRVDAIDISARALVRARSALYGSNSFRGNDLDFRKRYFELTPAGYRLIDAVSELVHFEQGNMLAAGFSPEAGIYDAIFCRNLLVYFDQTTRTRSIRILDRLLNADGAVFVGPAEASMMFDHGFIWSKVPFAFAFRKSATAVVGTATGLAALPQHDNRASALPPTPPFVKAPPPSQLVALRTPAPAPKVSLDDASKLGDCGRFVEAAESCREHIRAHGPSASAFHLMALLCSALGNITEAVRYFRKALYLDPGHRESLVHLALLLENRGDEAGALMLRDRLRRLKAPQGNVSR